jgi:hypothetical protein
MPTILLNTTNVDFGGPGSFGPYTYDLPNDTTNYDLVMGQANADHVDYIQLYIKVAVPGYTPPNPPPNVPVTAMIAVDIKGNQLRQDNIHIAALPCPPYCGN